MTPERWRDIEDAFHHALELSPEARATYLADVRSRDAALHAELAALLAADDDADAMLHGAIDRGAAALMGEATNARIGQRLGPYQLVALLGEGGMGSVYRAVRADAEYRREVAIKVLRPGASTAQTAARFRDERQILASLDHPGIVKLLDGGSTDDGAPFLVLEHIEGVPITRYADEHALSVAARIRLIVRVCDAVQYAHQQFVVHRDIKPSNVLVNNRGEPKLLDFGIAKLLDEGPAMRQAHTRTGVVPLTLAYASPEQARGGAVSTATDVYAIGAVLFELLTGAPPHPPAADPLEALRVICEIEVPRASTVAPPARRAPLVGDVDNILAKALRKEAARRYATVDQLADDLRRHLDGHTVTARAPTLTYRARKFARRNAGSLALGTAIAGVLVASTVWSLREAHRADSEAKRAEHGFAEGRKLARTLVFDIEDQLRELKGATALRERILDASLAYLDNLAGDASDDPGLARELARAYLKLGDVEANAYGPSIGDAPRALRSYQNAFALLDRMTTERDTPATRQVRISGTIGMGLAYQASGDAAKGAELLRSAMKQAEQLPPEVQLAPELVLQAYNGLFYFNDDPASSKVALGRMVELATTWRAREPANASARYWVAIAREGQSLTALDDAEGAARNLRMAVDDFAALARERPDDARFLRDHGVALVNLAASLGGIGNVQLWWPNVGDIDGAIAANRDGVEILSTLCARDPNDIRIRADVAGEMGTLGLLLLPRAPDEGLRQLERGLEELDQLTPAQRDNFYTRQDEWLLHCAIAAPLARVGRRADAEAHAERGLAMVRATSNDVQSSRVEDMCRYMVAEAHVELGDRDAAIALLSANVEDLGAVLAKPRPPVTALVGFAQSAARLAALVPADACALARRANEAWRAWPSRTEFITREQAERDRAEATACAAR